MLLVSLISLAVLVVVFFLALLTGRYSVSPEAFWTVITGGDPANAIDKSVILTLRLPRTIVALLVGVALSLSGLVYQETFQNKLVSPDFLGVSTGAGFGATIAIVLGCTGLMISFTAFLFGILTMLITVFIAKMFRSQSQTTLLLSGIIVGGFMSAGISFIKFMADTDKQLGEIVYWLLGTFSKATMKDVWVLLPVVAVCALYLKQQFRAPVNGFKYLLQSGNLLVGYGAVFKQAQFLYLLNSHSVYCADAVCGAVDSGVVAHDYMAVCGNVYINLN